MDNNMETFEIEVDGKSIEVHGPTLCSINGYWPDVTGYATVEDVDGRPYLVDIWQLPRPLIEVLGIRFED